MTKIQTWGLSEVLAWSDRTKLDRIEGLAEFFALQLIETEDGMRELLADRDGRAALHQVPGVGPKTADYLSILVGIPTVAVDRHMRSLLQGLGIAYPGYDQARDLFLAAAQELGVSPEILDANLWRLATQATRPV